MPTIRLANGLDLDLKVDVAESAWIARWLAALAELGIKGLDRAKADTPIEEPSLRAAQAGLSFDKPLSVGAGGVSATIAAGVNGYLAVRGPEDKGLFRGRFLGEDVPIGANEFWLGLGWKATLGVSGGASAGAFGFGFESGGEVQCANFAPFAPGTTLVDALRHTVAGFSLPSNAAELAAMPERTVAIAEGRGTLEFSGSFAVQAVPNPLYSTKLPVVNKPLTLRTGASVGVDASLAFSGSYQVRVQKIGPDAARVGIYRARGRDFSIGVEARAGVSASAPGGDLLERIMEALGGGHDAVDALEAAKLPPEQRAAITSALAKATGRKLELAAQLALDASVSTNAVFEIEVALGSLDDRGREAVGALLGGHVDKFARPGATLPPGFTIRQNLLERVAAHGVSLRLNLLGVLNFGSVVDLLVQGIATYEPQTGDWLVADSATATSVFAHVDNLADRSRRIRELLAESVLLSAAFRCGTGASDGLALSMHHCHFEQYSQTGRQALSDNLDVAQALGLLSDAEREALLASGTGDDFGASVFVAETQYDDAVLLRLFDVGATPRSAAEFEVIGRVALMSLVRPDDPDAFRRIPVRNDDLWDRMTHAGPAALHTLPELAGLDGPRMAKVQADYLLVRWWAQAMANLGTAVRDLRLYLSQHPGTLPGDPGLDAARSALDTALARVAAETGTIQFGDPWGLVAMHGAADGAEGARVLITARDVAFERHR